MSIRLRLTLWYSSILAVTLLVFGVVLYFTSSYLLFSEQEKQMKQVIRDLGPIRPVVDTQGQLGFSFPRSRELERTNVLIQILDENGGMRGNNWEGLVKIPISFNKELKEPVFTTELIEGKNVLIYHLPTVFKISGVSYTYFFQVLIIIDDIVYMLTMLKLILFVSSLFVVLLAASLGWFLARKALNPIENVIAAADQIEKGSDLGVRIPYEGPQDEIGRLTNTINGMLTRIQSAYTELEESDRAQRRFVSDASHELRTPLTTIRGNVELLEKMWRQVEVAPDALEDPERLAMSLEAMRDISGEATRMSRLVNDLLSLARADAGYQMNKEYVLLQDTVEAAARKAQHLPRTAEWIVGDLSCLEGVGVYGSKDYLQQLLFIFIENAFKYTMEGQVKLDALVKENQVGIRIADTGIGMDKDEVPMIFDRFYRADVSRGKTSGTGLGLSIAKWIIDEHGGSIEVMTRKDRGTTFIVWLPVSFHQLEE